MVLARDLVDRFFSFVRDLILVFLEDNNKQRFKGVVACCTVSSQGAFLAC